MGSNYVLAITYKNLFKHRSKVYRRFQQNSSSLYLMEGHTELILFVTAGKMSMD